MSERPPQACINKYVKYMTSCRKTTTPTKVNLDDLIIEIIKYRQTFTFEEGRDVIADKRMISRIVNKCIVRLS